MACRLMTSCGKDNSFSEIFSKFACISASTTPKECAGKRRIREDVKAGKISLYGAYKPKRPVSKPQLTMPTTPKVNYTVDAVT